MMRRLRERNPKECEIILYHSSKGVFVARGYPCREVLGRVVRGPLYTKEALEREKAGHPKALVYCTRGSEGDFYTPVPDEGLNAMVRGVAYIYEPLPKKKADELAREFNAIDAFGKRVMEDKIKARYG